MKPTAMLAAVCLMVVVSAAARAAQPFPPGGRPWSFTVYPEPATLALVAVGGLGVLARQRRRT